MSLVSTANQLTVTPPVAKKHSIEQPIGTQALLNDQLLAESPVKFWIQSQEEVQKSGVLSDLNYKMLKGYYRIFAW